MSNTKEQKQSFSKAQLLEFAEGVRKVVEPDIREMERGVMTGFAISPADLSRVDETHSAEFNEGFRAGLKYLLLAVGASVPPPLADADQSLYESIRPRRW